MMNTKQNTPDPEKVFTAIATIVSRRGEGKVRLEAVRDIKDKRKAG